MSYILEALKKAEAERRADVAQPAHLPPELGAARRPAHYGGKRRRLMLAAAGASALLAIAAGAAWYARDAAPANDMTAPIAEPRAATGPVVALPPAPAPAIHVPPPSADAPSTEPALKPKENVTKKAPPNRRPPAIEATHGAASPSPANDIALPALRDLPEQVRREIPSLAVGGYIYSGNPADRSVLINKRLLHEGEEIAPGLTLEQMTQNGMVLNYKGYRYRAPYN